MSVPTGHTCAAVMLTVATPKVHIVVSARKDSLEMDSSAQVIHIKSDFALYIYVLGYTVCSQTVCACV